MEQHKEFMKVAIEEASKSEWPFGAVIVKEGDVVASAGSGDDYDPTAHAEVNVIRRACDSLKTSSLKGCVMYASCEPCALCIGAIWYAGIRSVVYGSSLKELAQAGGPAWGEDLQFPYEQANWPNGDRVILKGSVMKNEVMKIYEQSPKIL